MGESVSKFLDYCDPLAVATNVRALVGRKRRRDEIDDQDNESDLFLEKTMHTPKKKKLITTAQYIYKALFKEGNNSDVTVIALGKPWRLHKVYLCQSPYFASMFSGSWKEATEDIVHIKVVDPNINLDSLYTVLGSLYFDEITLEPVEVVPTLAAATLFQLEGIIDQCTEIMIETVNAEETGVKITGGITNALGLVQQTNVDLKNTLLYKSTQISVYAHDLDIMRKSIIAIREVYKDMEAGATKVGLQINREKTKWMFKREITAVKYYEAGCEYGVQKVKDAALKWLLINLLSHFQDQPKRLREISVELMYKLVSSPDLFVMQTEFSLYVLLRFWVFLQLHPEWDSTSRESLVDAHQYFQNREGEDAFLLTPEGKNYTGPFRALRFLHLVNHHLDIEMLKTDRIVPAEWLSPAVYQQWYHMLRIDQGLDRGPQAIGNDEFCRDCVRCGRTLVNPGEHVWRWTGFNMGLDLIWSCSTRSLRVKRNNRTEHEMMLSMLTRRHIVCRVTLASLNEQRQVKHTQSTGLKCLTLFKNEEVPLLVLDKDLTYPLLVSVNLLFNTSVVATTESSSTEINPSAAQNIAQEGQ